MNGVNHRYDVCLIYGILMRGRRDGTTPAGCRAREHPGADDHVGQVKGRGAGPLLIMELLSLALSHAARVGRLEETAV